MSIMNIAKGAIESGFCEGGVGKVGKLLLLKLFFDNFLLTPRHLIEDTGWESIQKTHLFFEFSQRVICPCGQKSLP